MLTASWEEAAPPRPVSPLLAPCRAPPPRPGSQWALGPAPALDNSSLRLVLAFLPLPRSPPPRSRPAHPLMRQRDRGDCPRQLPCAPSPQPAIWPGVGLLTAKPPARPGAALQSGSPTTPSPALASPCSQASSHHPPLPGLSALKEPPRILSWAAREDS